VPAHEIVARGIATCRGRRIFNRLTVRENLTMAHICAPTPTCGDSTARSSYFPV